MKGNCSNCQVDKSCDQKKCDWYINSPDYFNCFNVFKYFIRRPYTLQEIAKMLDTSHTSIKLVESTAMEKIKQMADNNEVLNELRQLIQEDSV